MTQEELREELRKLSRMITTLIVSFEEKSKWELSSISISRLNIGTLENPTKSLPRVYCEINMSTLGE